MAQGGEVTVYAAVGGADGVERLAHAWHERCLRDEVVAHAFSHGFRDDHTERLAAYWGEQLGGPATYSEGLGDHAQVLRMHAGNGPHPEMDRRAEACFAAALDDIGVGDERLRAVLVAWFTAMVEEMDRYPGSADDVPADEPVPRWSWEGRVG